MTFSIFTGDLASSSFGVDGNLLLVDEYPGLLNPNTLVFDFNIIPSRPLLDYGRGHVYHFGVGPHIWVTVLLLLIDKLDVLARFQNSIEGGGGFDEMGGDGRRWGEGSRGGWPCCAPWIAVCGTDGLTVKWTAK